LDEIDLDLGSAGPILIPGTQYLLGGGKLGWLYLGPKQEILYSEGCAD
jgi:hypothetical protein